MKRKTQRDFISAKKDMSTILDCTSCEAAKQAVLRMNQMVLVMENYFEKGRLSVKIGDLTQREFDAFTEAYFRTLYEDLASIESIYLRSTDSSLSEKAIDYKRVVAAKQLVYQLL